MKLFGYLQPKDPIRKLYCINIAPEEISDQLSDETYVIALWIGLFLLLKYVLGYGCCLFLKAFVWGFGPTTCLRSILAACLAPVGASIRWALGIFNKRPTPSCNPEKPLFDVRTWE
mmetsp:Transcript_22403/g.33388  ORF Transcript_22403/g.33388 Transcript_22403/m.33388 type:complete len:116 (+) Transcript_22403:427-774(+)